MCVSNPTKEQQTCGIFLTTGEVWISLLLFAPVFCYFRIPKTTGPKERFFWVNAHHRILPFMIGAAIGLVYMYGVAIGLGYVLGPAYKLLIWALTLLVFVTGIRIGNRGAAQIKADELQEKPTQSQAVAQHRLFLDPSQTTSETPMRVSELSQGAAANWPPYSNACCLPVAV